MADKMLVTGGCGFLGHHIIEHFLKNTDFNIDIIDRMSYAASGLDRVRDINVFDDKRVKFYATDITRPLSEGILQECGDVKYILHIAAESITEDTFLPIYLPHIGTKVMSFGELWNQKSRYSDVEKTEKGEKIRINDSSKVLSFYNGGQWCKIKYITRHKYKGKIIKLLQKNAILEATPNHSIYSANLELSSPMYNPDLLVVRNINESGKVYKEESKNLLKFLAAYITEGKCSNLCISNKKLYNYLENEYGKSSNNKKMPDWIFDLKPELREYFWECLLEGDGDIEENGNQRYTTSSKLLACQIGLLLSLQNKTFTINEEESDKNECNTYWNFHVNIKGNQQINCDDKKIKEIEYDGWVYDLEVEYSHNFVCGIGNAVCHNTHVDNSIINPMSFVYANVVGTGNMLEFARKCKKLESFCYFSTDEVFGPAPDGVLYKEWDRYNCTNPYSATKAGAEQLCLSFMNTYNLPGFIIHCMNIFGERQHPEKFIPMIIRKVKHGETITIHSNKQKTKAGSRFYIHARNVANAVDFLLNRFEQREIYNIVGEEELSNLELAKMIADIMGKELKYEMVDFHSSRPGHDLRYSLDGGKMEKMGWKVPITIKDSLKNMVKWTLDNEKWLYIGGHK